LTHKFFYRAFHFIFFILSLSAISPCRAEDLKKVIFMPQWQPQAQFAGFYVAQEKGIYRKYGIDLTILRGGPESPSLEALVRGKADFVTLFLSTGIQQRAKGIRLVNIGQIVQKSGFILVAKKTSGIKQPKDLNGKKVSIWPDFQLQPMAFFRKYGLTVETVPQAETLNLFLRGGVDVASAMWYNEYHLLLNSGMSNDELTTFFFDKYGLNFPEDGIYCLEETLKRNREKCCNFVKATLEGWRYAFQHPDEALDIVMKYVKEANIATNRIHQKWMLKRMKDIISVPGKNAPMGSLSEKDYHTVASELKLNGIISELPDFEKFHVDCTGKK
jgi:NitT/TauT family transport system substrate-binding protein